MPKQQIYQDKELPEPFKWQVLDFLRIVWSDGFEGKNSTRDWITKSSHHPLHFVLIESNNLLVSYVGVVWKYLEHAGEAYKMYGLSGVFTYPQFRGQHYGLNLFLHITRLVGRELLSRGYKGAKQINLFELTTLIYYVLNIIFYKIECFIPLLISGIWFPEFSS